ncbi:CBS domain-containing protein, partial [Streptomyces sp. 12297]
MTDHTVGSSADEPLGRASYLIEGRRVLLSDLIHAGLLSTGQRLTFRQRRSGQKHLAQVTADGRIELGDGQRFKSPSAAAAAATGRGPYDGWTSWALDDGTLLDALRQRLLDTVAELPPSGDVAAD